MGNDTNNRNEIENLIDDAWTELEDSFEGHYGLSAQIARKVLGLDPTAVDAYVILARSAETTAERIALLREAIRQGEIRWRQYLGRPPKDFFWWTLETRPFIRALQHLMLVYSEAADLQEAAALADRLLRLCPNDSLGVRYLALSWHPVLGNWQRFEALLKKYRGATRTEDLYAHCLNCVRQGAGAREALDAALAVNPHVPGLLLAASPPAKEDGTHLSYGSNEEAKAYAADNRAAWAAVPNALGWLRGELGRGKGIE